MHNNNLVAASLCWCSVWLGWVRKSRAEEREQQARISGGRRERERNCENARKEEKKTK